MKDFSTISYIYTMRKMARATEDSKAAEKRMSLLLIIDAFGGLALARPSNVRQEHVCPFRSWTCPSCRCSSCCSSSCCHPSWTTFCLYSCLFHPFLCPILNLDKPKSSSIHAGLLALLQARIRKNSSLGSNCLDRISLLDDGPCVSSLGNHNSFHIYSIWSWVCTLVA